MLFSIVYNIVAPVFMLVGLGFLLDRKVKFDSKTLADLNFYAFVPALVFLKIVEAPTSLVLMQTVGLFCVVHILSLYGISKGICLFHSELRKKEVILSLGTMFYNAGNYGIPLILLAFGEEHLNVIAVILVIQNFLCFTVGIAILEKGKNPGKILINLVKIPTIQAILLALIIKLISFDFLSFKLLAVPVKFLADGLIPFALITLGTQLSKATPSGIQWPLIFLNGIRLIVSPLLAMVLIPFFGFSPPISSILIVSAGLPVAVNVAILAGVYKQDEDLASQSVFYSTILSAFTISLLLLFFHS